MRLHLVLALAASLGLASADQCISKYPTDCGFTGSRTDSPIDSTDQTSFAIPEQCGAWCESQDTCESFAVESGSCYLYSVPVTENPTTSPAGDVNITFYDLDCTNSTQICQAFGSRSASNAAFSSSAKFTDNSFDGCHALCSSTAGCEAFSIEIESGGECQLYAEPLVEDLILDSSSLQVLFDLNCPEPVVGGPSITLLATTSTIPTLNSDPTPGQTFTPYTAPTIKSSDSPPYTPTGPLVTPTNVDQFTATYTYTEYTITLNATGSPPITTGIAPLPLPSAPCMISPGAQFTLLNENFIPMVSTTNSIGPLLQPTAAPAPGDPILNPADLVLPAFYLQASPQVTGVYDMVYAGKTIQFVAMTTTGDVILVDASTGASFIDNSITSIFNVDCFGVIFITFGSSKYIWSTDGQSCTMVEASTPANNMKALPVTIPGAQATPNTNKRDQELLDELLKRADSKELAKRQAGASAPTCANTPAGLDYETKSTYVLDTGNLCNNVSNNWSLSPFSFDGSCAIQSLCYDQCQDFSWDGCNAIFSYAMLLSCAANFENWWQVVEAVACAAQAAYFTSLAATSTGRNLYDTAQGSMCACFCTSPPDTCLFTTGSFYCADIGGSDNNNCGGCGTQCGANSACKSGACGCPIDQCGKTCVDFRDDPKNCGGCGNVCDPAYCIGGFCYAPAPDQCAPDEGVTNNSFEDYSPTWANWTFAAYPGCILGTNIIFSPTDYTPQTGNSTLALGVEMTNLPSSGCQTAVSQARVKMCPGFNYELTFNMGYVNQVSGSDVTSNADCQARWLTGTPDTWDDIDGFQISPYYSIGISNPTYETFGPWPFSVAAGDKGVTQSGPNLYIDLTVVLDCSTPLDGTGRFVLTDIELNAVSAIVHRSLTTGEEKGGVTFKQRDNSATNMSEALAPYYPTQGIDKSSFTLATVRERV